MQIRRAMSSEEKNKGGRPSLYTEELCDLICGRIAMGESLKTISKSEDMPSCVTMFAWMRKHPEFLNRYAQAKEEQADALAEEILDIADDGTNDWMEKNNADGENIGWTLNGEHVQRSRLRIDSRKWIAAKLKPKKYSDSQNLNVGGQNGVNPIQASLTVTYVDTDNNSEGV